MAIVLGHDGAARMIQAQAAFDPRRRGGAGAVGVLPISARAPLGTRRAPRRAGALAAMQRRGLFASRRRPPLMGGTRSASSSTRWRCWSRSRSRPPACPDRPAAIESAAAAGGAGAGALGDAPGVAPVVRSRLPARIHRPPTPCYRCRCEGDPRRAGHEEVSRSTAVWAGHADPVAPPSRRGPPARAFPEGATSRAIGRGAFARVLHQLSKTKTLIRAWFGRHERAVLVAAGAAVALAVVGGKKGRSGSPSRTSACCGAAHAGEQRAAVACGEGVRGGAAQRRARPRLQLPEGRRYPAGGRFEGGGP